MERELVERKLKTVKKQLTNNTILGVIAILILGFVPWIQFENFMFKISLENIIAFYVLIVCIIKGFSLRSKKKELEDELSVYSEKKRKEVKIEPKIPEEEFICEYCDKKLKYALSVRNTGIQGVGIRVFGYIWNTKLGDTDWWLSCHNDYKMALLAKRYTIFKRERINIKKQLKKEA